MMVQIDVLRESLFRVRCEEEFDIWVRNDLRRALPHAVLLGTMGKLLGMSSLATHRIGVDFPLNLVESLKTSSGALDDPLVRRWFQSGRPGYMNVVESAEKGQRHWRTTMLRYGIEGISIHGVLDHTAKRFAMFQMGNIYGGGSVENLQLLSALSKGMSDAVWRLIELRSGELARGITCHPTFGLTATELHIVELLAQGLSNKEIARRRGVSDSTIKTQVQRTGAKLGATRRAEIVAIAMPMLSGLPAQTMIDYDDF